MRIRTALAALALAAAGLLLGAAPAASAASTIEFGDLIITTEQSPDVVAGCNAGGISLSPSAQCGVFHINAL
ncbi:hypothetical protein [Streptomyces clavuligerus]|nr:hypothetical protein [Streptomyces clavuligerus]ANW21546.1 hypothetical protein BB341_26710 [Streptomyces clavuligerus]AXU16176.1 hypothetical protein D1794_27765 [Streptomyces clavuligerus]MBY6306326.1 hypothetical protein [Streptomyces clavuligerus]QCS08955.1 hypothetical protein CRV15_27130 [Streptomyces clavuligerus]QPJ91710.1 hypothetical protein GE265_01030 [Streptomyces clavuligerus]